MSEKKLNLGKVFLNGVITENPTFRLVLGTCPTLAVTTSAINGVGMGAAATFVLLGNVTGAVGETCKIAILIGFVYLLATRTIRWEIPVITLASAALLGWLLGTDPLTTVLSGGLLFGAVYMATDYVTTPMNSLARYLYAVGIGVIVVLIRKYGSYPEGVTYAILLMNIAATLFDRIPVQRIYGHTNAKKEGK